MGNNSININEKIFNLVFEWRAFGVPFNDSVRCLLYLLTLKKVLDKPEECDIEDFQSIMKLQKCMYAFRKGEDEELLFAKSGRIIEKRFHLQEGFFDNVFAHASNMRMWKEHLSSSLKIIDEIFNTADNKMMLCIEGAIFKVFLMEGQRLPAIISSNAIADLLDAIVSVQDGDKFFDGTIGCGISAIRCVTGTDATVAGMDINVSALQTATLFAILSGRENFEMKVGDFTLDTSKEKYDKIAMDIPFSVKTGEYVGEQIAICHKWLDGVQGKDLDVLILAKVLDVLKEEGRAAVVVPNSFLFKINKANKILREQILEKKMLRAVIGLPVLHYGTSTKSSILLLEKNKDEVLFVDMDSDKADFFHKMRRELSVLSAKGKIKLLDILKSKKEIEGVSVLVDIQQLKENEFDFSPIRYISVRKSVSFRSVSSINHELAIVNEKLQEIEKRINNNELFN